MPQDSSDGYHAPSNPMVPSAPYPPIHTSSPARSSMSASPQYHQQTSAPSQQQSSIGMAIGGSQNGRKSKTTHPSRIEGSIQNVNAAATSSLRHSSTEGVDFETNANHFRNGGGSIRNKPIQVSNGKRSHIPSSLSTSSSSSSILNTHPHQTSPHPILHHHQSQQQQQQQQQQNQQTIVSRVRFYPNGSIACINAAANKTSKTFFAEGDPASTIPGQHQQQPMRNLKVGPALLELRQLELIEEDLDTESGNNTQQDKEHYQQQQQQQQSLFRTKTMAISRGNPQLGTSVASTCLDIPPTLSFDPIFSSPGSVVQNYGSRFAAATGLTTGMLAIHSLTTTDSGSNGGENDASPATSLAKVSSDLPFSSSIEYYHISRHHRHASAVAWRPSQTNHVAIGLLGTGSGNNSAVVGAGTGGPQPGPRRSGTIRGGGSGGGDREFCCFLWDIEASAGKRNAAPVSKLSHNTPVASLAWVVDGQMLALGTQSRNVQLYDMRVAGTNVPPLSALAHNFGVHGIEVDPQKPNTMATFCRAIGEPVKIWDVRRMDSVVSEIKLPNPIGSAQSTEYESTQSKVEAIRWSPTESSILTVAMGDTVQDYDTSSGSRPVLMRACHVKQRVQDIDLFGGKWNSKLSKNDKTEDLLVDRVGNALYHRRMIAILQDGSICDVAKQGRASPVAISRRDGRLVHAFGSTVWIGSTRNGPCAMENVESFEDEDISATMMRRARCFRQFRYSMDTSQNVKMLSEDIPSGIVLKKTILLSRFSLFRLWVWIERVEALSTESDENEIDHPWPSKSLLDAGVVELLNKGGQSSKDAVGISETLACNVYSSPTRHLALTSCGWAAKSSLDIVLAECEALGEYERSAALAVWHGDIGAACDALQRASEAVRDHMAGKKTMDFSLASPNYAETLDLIAMCVAGFGGTTASQRLVWRNACSSLLRRPDLADPQIKTSRTVYLRALCHFLLNVGIDTTFDYILSNDYLAYTDRIAFACLFLDRENLQGYLAKCLQKCQQSGNVEGLVLSGLSKDGLKIMQAFVDRTSDVQTAALVISRVLLPQEWTEERKISMEWVEAYRGLLNSWQMWQSRAMFDVDRAETIRRIKTKGNDPGLVRRIQTRRQGSRSTENNVLASIPAALDARCNYCSSPLGLRRHEGNANQWLSKMKPILSCCPQCRKPLPRCSICLLGLGALNPYMQLTRERSRPITRNPISGQEDLGALPLAEWFTWCMNCKHGGHAHHLVGWFASHETCPVSGCECHCQFDGIQKLSRPGLAK